MSNPSHIDLFEAWYVDTYGTKALQDWGFRGEKETIFKAGYQAGYLSATLTGGVNVTPATPFNPLDHEQTK